MGGWTGQNHAQMDTSSLEEFHKDSGTGSLDLGHFE